MPFDLKQFLIASLTMLGGVMLQSAAQATDYSNSSAYNTPIGMQSGQENAPVNSSLRDGNGNLTVINGQFTSSAMSQASGVSSASAFGSSSSGVSTGTARTMFGGASAIGNALNVVTVGSNNTVIVNSTQTNNGNQNASVSLNGH